MPSARHPSKTKPLSLFMRLGPCAYSAPPFLAFLPYFLSTPSPGPETRANQASVNVRPPSQRPPPGDEALHAAQCRPQGCPSCDSPEHHPTQQASATLERRKVSCRRMEKRWR
jgi:hypothetical protein